MNYARYNRKTGKPAQISLTYIKNLPLNGGATLRHGCRVTFKHGYQVGLSGEIFKAAYDAFKFIRDNCGKGDWGIWRGEDGLYYVDKGVHIMGKTVALELGRQYNQQCIYGWKQDKTFDC